MGLLDRLTVRSRKRASRADPIAAALEDAAAAGPLRILIEGEQQPALTELPDWIGVDEDDEMDGFNTVVELDDEIHFYCDPADGLDLALAEQRGIKEAYAEDREVIYVRTRLHLDDVAAAVIRAVVDINRNPRDPDEGGERRLLPSVAPTGIPAWMVMSREIVDAVAPQIGEAGYSRREGFFRRAGRDGFVQMLSVRWSPDEHPDETFGHDRIWVGYGVWIPGPRGQPMPADLDAVTLLEATLSSGERLLPDPAVVAEALETTALPWLEATDGRDALAAWAAEDPGRIDPPTQRPLIARLLTEWGYPDAARRVNPEGPSR